MSNYKLTLVSLALFLSVGRHWSVAPVTTEVDAQEEIGECRRLAIMLLGQSGTKNFSCGVEHYLPLVFNVGWLETGLVEIGLSFSVDEFSAGECWLVAAISPADSDLCPHGEEIVYRMTPGTQWVRHEQKLVEEGRSPVLVLVSPLSKQAIQDIESVVAKLTP